MLIFAPKETADNESRAAITPDYVKKIVALGATVSVEAGIGIRCLHSDDEYRAAGAEISTDARSTFAAADIVLRVRRPEAENVSQLKNGAIHISFLDPFNEKSLLEKFAQAGTSAISLEMVPRTTLAQKMDVLSSQANLAGYVAVMLAAERSPGILPMMMTPAGTITPAKIFILGAGVAGLQAIATARRMGARVTAFDIRPETAEQIQSLGAKYLKIDLGGDTGSTAQGYAKELTQDQKKKQSDAQAKAIAESDIVITTAKVFGRKSPVLISADVVKKMRPGSIIVDLAAETGGNVEGTVCDQEYVTPEGVRIIGFGSLECHVPRHSSQVLAANFFAMIQHFWDEEKKEFKLDRDDEIMAGCLITHAGAIVHPRFGGEQKTEEKSPAEAVKEPENAEKTELPKPGVTPASQPTEPNAGRPSD